MRSTPMRSILTRSTFHEFNFHKINLRSTYKTDQIRAIWYLKVVLLLLTTTLLPSEVALAEQPALWFWHLQNWKSFAPSLILV